MTCWLSAAVPELATRLRLAPARVSDLHRWYRGRFDKCRHQGRLTSNQDSPEPQRA